MEVACYTENNSLALRNTFLLVRPFPGKFDRSFDGLGASVHRENHIISEDSGYLLGEPAKDAVIEGS